MVYDIWDFNFSSVVIPVVVFLRTSGNLASQRMSELQRWWVVLKLDKSALYQQGLNHSGRSHDQDVVGSNPTWCDQLAYSFLFSFNPSCAAKHSFPGGGASLSLSGTAGRMFGNFSEVSAT